MVRSKHQGTSGWRRCVDCCCYCSCFRAKFTPNRPRNETTTTTTPLQHFSGSRKPSDGPDGVPLVEVTSGCEIDPIIIRDIDPCLALNGIQHHTSQYYEMKCTEGPNQLVVRRGQSFQLILTLSRSYNADKDAISFIFTVEDEYNSTYGHGTLVAVPLLKKSKTSLYWSAIVEDVSSLDNKVTVLVTPTADAVVAKWRLEIDTKCLGGDENGASYSYCWSTFVYILFNPWCKADQVYLRSDEWRDETILNESGLIWRGTANRMRPVIWKYDQFEKDTLDCVFYLIKVIGKVQGVHRADPVRVSRCLTAATNAADDMGVVMGNWTEDMGGGTHPTKWLGSKEILQKYFKKKRPVKYGQCWVFSGVLCTLCRAIGIPCRVVTNYSSAHDTQNSLTVDYFLDEHGTIMEELKADSIWNFHVWNECWMQRPDLGREYGGWQVIDATPQEISDGMYRVGPTSVMAIKLGEVLRPYDTAFLYAEVNADKVYWKYTGPTQPLKLLGKDSTGIGKLISTKAANQFEREDITASYKYAESTNEERATMLKALKQSEHLYSRYYLNEDFNDVYFDLQLNDDIKIGRPFKVVLVMRNRHKSQSYRITCTIRVEVMTYTGDINDLVKMEQFDLSVDAKSKTQAELTVNFEDYHKKLVKHAALNVTCLAHVADTKYEYFAQDNFRVRKPDIKIVLLEKPIEKHLTHVEISVENPLPIDIKAGEFLVDAPGFDRTMKLKVGGRIAAGQLASTVFQFTPRFTGRQTIAAKFSSKEMDDVDGYSVIMVLPEKETNGVL